jgi:hypothetical protein
LKHWEIKIDFEEENILINRKKLLIEIRRKEKQWAKLIYSIMLQSKQWIQVKIKVPKGELNKLEEKLAGELVLKIRNM